MILQIGNSIAWKEMYTSYLQISKAPKKCPHMPNQLRLNISTGIKRFKDFKKAGSRDSNVEWVTIRLQRGLVHPCPGCHTTEVSQEPMAVIYNCSRFLSSPHQ